MKEFKNTKELYVYLKPAFLVKIRILKLLSYDYINSEDIWNYLRENIWVKSNNLTISEMVNDIIHADPKKIDNYVKVRYLSKERVIDVGDIK